MLGNSVVGDAPQWTMRLGFQGKEMSAIDYQVVFTGRLCEGVTRRDGIAHLSKKFGLDFHQINKLLSGGSSVVKRFERESDAVQLVRAFAAAGWSSEIRSPETRQIEPPQTEAHQSAHSSHEMIASDGSCSLQVPEHWQTLQGLNKSAVIQVGDLDSNEFCVVLWQELQSKDSMASMKEYCDAQLRQCAGQINGGSIVSEAAPFVKISFDGFVGEISADIDEIPVRYLVACSSKNGRAFTQFLWCEAHEFEQKRPQLLSVLSSFQGGKTQPEAAARMGRMSRRKRRMRA